MKNQKQKNNNYATGWKHHKEKKINTLAVSFSSLKP